MPSEGRFHAEYDSERSYSKEELAQMFASVEWQAAPFCFKSAGLALS